MSSDDPEADALIDELDFSPPRLLGAVPRETEGYFVRDLTKADLQALDAPRGTLPKAIQRIRASHHSLARCLASGIKPVQAALVTGYSQTRISLLLRDPTFAGLVEDYKREAREIFADLNERMVNLSLDAIEELQDRLADAPEGFSTGMLLDMVKACADRTGHGPGQEVKLSVSPSMIDRPPKESYEEWQKRRARELGADSDIEISLGTSTRTTN
jgi:hypothetical protein